jgi:hypothetical protein
MSKKAIAGTTAVVIGVPILAKYAYDRRNGGSKPLSEPDNTANDKQLIISRFNSISDFGPILAFYRIYLRFQNAIQSVTQVTQQSLKTLIHYSTNKEFRSAFSNVTDENDYTRLLLSFYIHSCCFVAYDVFLQCSRRTVTDNMACGWIMNNVDTFEQLIIRYVTNSETWGVFGIEISKDTFDIVVRNIDEFFNETKSPMVDLQTKCLSLDT